MNIGHIKEQALDYLLRHGSHPPAVHLYGAKRWSIVLLENIPQDALLKQKALFLAGAKAAHAQNIGTLQELFLVSEAWVSVKQSMKELNGPPSTDPDRKEALVGVSVTNVKRVFTSSEVFFHHIEETW